MPAKKGSWLRQQNYVLVKKTRHIFNEKWLFVVVAQVLRHSVGLLQPHSIFVVVFAFARLCSTKKSLFKFINLKWNFRKSFYYVLLLLSARIYTFNVYMFVGVYICAYHFWWGEISRSYFSHFKSWICIASNYEAFGRVKTYLL